MRLHFMWIWNTAIQEILTSLTLCTKFEIIWIQKNSARIMCFVTCLELCEVFRKASSHKMWPHCTLRIGSATIYTLLFHDTWVCHTTFISSLVVSYFNIVTLATKDHLELGSLHDTGWNSTFILKTQPVYSLLVLNSRLTHNMHQ
jgi:hypothetical protein